MFRSIIENNFIKRSALCLTLAFSLNLTSKADDWNQPLSIVPQPVQVVVNEGSYPLPSKITISVPDDSLLKVVSNFARVIEKSTGFEVIPGQEEHATIRLVNDPEIAKDGYGLHINSQGIAINAAEKSGFIFGLQSLRQIIVESIKNGNEIPYVNIFDEPRFNYRGMMMDASRYFVPKEEMLRLIDAMSLLKLNKLHWHLTDDNGWRIEIKQYPLLTEIGSKRVNRGDTPFPARRNPEPGEPTPDGGFYTQNDIREIVAYAADNGIEVIPEIDMPAHANAALAAYPQYACPVVDKFIGVLPGIGGDNADIIYCAGNDSTISFLKNILDEVVELFPSQYIHIGGDEAWKTHWDKCPLCQERIVQENLNNSEELQGWFMTTMSDYLRSKGRKVIGWDELTNSTLPEEAIIMGWQGNGNAALKAAAQGHNFIMTPAQLMYFIRYQGPQWFEPLTYFAGGNLKDVYEYEPVKDNWDPEYENLLLGVQGSMWNEFCHNNKDVEYQLFPRLTALAEVAWRPKRSADWNDYLQRLDNFLPLLDEMGITYARSMYNIQHKSIPSDGQLEISLECIRPDVEIRYTLDSEEPSATSRLYNGPFKIGSDTNMVKAATFQNGERKGEILILPVSWHKATGKQVLDAKGLEYVLTNGIAGSLKQTDLEWVTWNINDSMAFVVDLLEPTAINNISLGFINNFGMAVHRPKALRIGLSDDNENYATVASKNFSQDEIFTEGTMRFDEPFNIEDHQARFVKVELFDPGVCPPQHTRPGKKVQVYIDEITIN